MKVLIQIRVDAFDKYGGDTVHAEKTVEVVRALGVDADLSTETTPDLSGYDLVHVFNLDWVRDTYLQCKNAQSQGKPIVLSPLHHNFSEIAEFERKARYGLRRLVNPLFRSFIHREYLKNIYRAFIDFDKRKWYGTVVQLKKGIVNQYSEVLEMANLVIPNTNLESEEIRREFGVDIKAMTVPAGVDARFKDATPDWFRKNYPGVSRSLGGDFALMVGRIEPRKNQLKVIEALNETPIPLLIVGGFNSHHPEYALRVKRGLKKYPNIFHIERIPHENIGSVFAACKVHILASWFETTGLVNLEAGLTGANVVSTNRGFGKEYVKDFVWYIDPEDKDSIRHSVLEAMQAPRQTELREHVLNNYTWHRVGELTVEAYQKVL